jgi:hypothetical protein
MMTDALSRLQPEEICTIVLHDGTKRDAAWSPNDHRFAFCDGLGEGSVSHDEVYEWWPASVRF